MYRILRCKFLREYQRLTQNVRIVYFKVTYEKDIERTLNVNKNFIYNKQYESKSQ